MKKITNIACIGAGFVGGPSMAVIALKNPKINVTVVDINKDKIDAWNGPLNNLPVYEPGLNEIVGKIRDKNLFFSSDIDLAIEKAEMIFISVNTPTKTYGEGKGFASDLTYIERSARHIAKVAKSDKIIVEKSTLPVKTAEKIKEVLEAESDGIKFEVLSNPEFLAEGTAIEDLLNSDRVLIGGNNSISGKRAVDTLKEIYSSWVPLDKILTTNVWSSELSKLASNAMLAQRVSSINSLTALCEATGASISEVSKAVGMDSRIGSKFLKASVGFGGSCFQKDILNLVYLCKYYGLDEVAEYWHQVVKINDYQKNRFAKKVIEGLNGTVNQKKITFLGWAFKKDTNDSRESPAIYVANYLLEEGAEIHIYDPMVKENQIRKDMSTMWETRGYMQEKKSQFNKQIFVQEDYQKAINKSYAVCILTEWDEFISYDWDKLTNQMIKPVKVFDGRNILNFGEKLG